MKVMSDGTVRRRGLAGATLALRCYAHGNGDSWEAICVDLDVATFGPSLDEVKASLLDCIEMYLEGVRDLPVEERRHFLARRSPWHVRAKLAIMTWVSGLRQGARKARQFTLHSQASVHP